MLNSLIKKNSLVVIGLNAGTSADGLDLAAIRIVFSKRSPKVSFIGGETVPYPKLLSLGVNSGISNRIRSVDEVIQLDRLLGIFYGEQAKKFSASLRRQGIIADLLASHGQTIRHLTGKVLGRNKKESGSLQLGHPESIAEQTGLITVADFRQADIACGGEGAPITSYAMWQLFSHTKEDRLIVNIGGIANYFFFPAGCSPQKAKARDCGPGNSLIDIITEKYFHRSFDCYGRLAARGRISQRLLILLMADDYLKGKCGPSTGRERFGDKFADKIIKYGKQLKLNGLDLLATATELTAITIANSIQGFINKHALEKSYFLGGGFKNRYLLGRLKAYLPKTSLISIDRLGYNPDYLEAVCYAVMGAMAIKSRPTGLAHITGAKKQSVAGRIIQPPTDKN
ncbi:MAG: anhydro-N-acetylmuramic acid kinase [candidate division Zixibacteria bacterium]|nr:anhydro-N-acetylmuramic acid kinase [candidate division Zixibacteria bacterium]